jgi:hypothetical protein
MFSFEKKYRIYFVIKREKDIFAIELGKLILDIIPVLITKK